MAAHRLFSWCCRAQWVSQKLSQLTVEPDPGPGLYLVKNGPFWASFSISSVLLTNLNKLMSKMIYIVSWFQLLTPWSPVSFRNRGTLLVSLLHGQEFCDPESFFCACDNFALICRWKGLNFLKCPLPLEEFVFYQPKLITGRGHTCHHCPDCFSFFVQCLFLIMSQANIVGGIINLALTKQTKIWSFENGGSGLLACLPTSAFHQKLSPF